MYVGNRELHCLQPPFAGLEGRKERIGKYAHVRAKMLETSALSDQANDFRYSHWAFPNAICYFELSIFYL